MTRLPPPALEILVTMPRGACIKRHSEPQPQEPEGPPAKANRGDLRKVTDLQLGATQTASRLKV